MNEQDVVHYLQSKSIQVKGSTSTQFILDCPVCGRDQKVYMGKQNGIWDCKAGSCGAAGNLYTFAKTSTSKHETTINEDLVNRYQDLLKGDSKAQNWLLRRGYTQATIQQFKIGVNESGYISLPFYDLNNHLYAIKYRNLDFELQHQKYELLQSQGVESNSKPKKWVSIGAAPGLLNLNSIDFKKPILLTEGEWDTIVAVQMGIGNVVSTPGCTNRKWIDDIKDIKEIYVCYDNDEAGNKAAQDIASRLGLHRCFRVQLPDSYKDLNEAFCQGFTTEDLKSCLQQAEKFPVAGISTTERFSDSIIYDVLNPNKMRGYSLGHPKLDKMTKGFAEQELRVVTGRISTGKTTWIMDEMLRYAKQEIPSVIFSLETPVKKVIKDMLQAFVSEPLSEMPEDDIRQAIKELSELPIHWFDSRNFEDKFDLNRLKDMIRQTRDRYGVKFVVLDDLDFMLTSTPKNQSEVEAVGYLMTELKTLANNLELHIVVIAHINKQAGEGIPRMLDIRGSQAIPARADSVMIIHRETSPDADPELKKDVLVVMDKNRLGEDTGMVHFNFDPIKRTYTEDR